MDRSRNERVTARASKNEKEKEIAEGWTRAVEMERGETIT